jgi:hypothetical protein
LRPCEGAAVESASQQLVQGFQKGLVLLTLNGPIGQGGDAVFDHTPLRLVPMRGRHNPFVRVDPGAYLVE